MAEGGHTFNGRMGDRKKGERIEVRGRFVGKVNALRFGGNEKRTRRRLSRDLIGEETVGGGS